MALSLPHLSTRSTRHEKPTVIRPHCPRSSPYRGFFRETIALYTAAPSFLGKQTSTRSSNDVYSEPTRSTRRPFRPSYRGVVFAPLPLSPLALAHLYRFLSALFTHSWQTRFELLLRATLPRLSGSQSLRFVYDKPTLSGDDSFLSYSPSSTPAFLSPSRATFSLDPVHLPVADPSDGCLLC